MCLFGSGTGKMPVPYALYVDPPKKRKQVPAWMAAQVIAQRQRRGLESQKKRKKPAGDSELDLAGNLLGGE